MFETKKQSTKIIGDETQDTYIVNNKNRNLTIDDMRNAHNAFKTKLKRAHPEGKILIRALTHYGFRTIKGFSQDELQLEDEEDYLNARGVKKTSKFTNSFYQFQITIKY